jgi:ankyrin repeat protein
MNSMRFPLVVGMTAALPVIALALSPVLAGQNVAPKGSAPGAGQDAPKPPVGPGAEVPDPLGPDLFIAIHENDLPRVKELLARGAKPNGRNWLGLTPLLWAASLGNDAACAALLEAGADIKTDSNFGGPLEVAAWGRNPALIKRLLERGVAPSKQRGDGYTALMTAAENGDAEIVKLLLAAKANPNTPDGYGMTALAHAARRGQTETARLLLAAGAKAETTDKGGRTPLMYAAMNGNAPIVQLLLGKGARAAAKDTKGETALLLAAKYSGSAEVARLLARAGGGSEKDGQGRTAASLALRRGYGAYAAALNPQARNIVVSTNVGGASARMNEARRAVLKSLSLLETTTKNFTARSGETCVSCHHQGLGLMATGVLKSLGYRIDENLAESEQKVVTGFFEADLPKLRELVGHPEMYKHAPAVDMQEFPPLVGGAFAALNSHGKPSTEALAAMTTILARQQAADGGWKYGFERAPQQSSRFTFTAYAIQAMKAYLPAPLAKERDERIARAVAWMTATPAVTNEDRTFKLLGLKWADAPQAAIAQAKADLLKTQRPDGGWAQFAGATPAGDVFRRSDAYATGQALYALHIGGGLPTNDPAYGRGVAYLLRTQDEDGSWYVNKRAIQANNYFDTGFPHGQSQYASYNGTAWAAMALGLAAKAAPAATATR